MTKPRKELVSIDNTPYYHITSRCVRRAFLCGFDKDTQTDYEHRRQWIVDRLRLLSSLFSINLCAYAVMSNHYHIVVKLHPEESLQWSDSDVIERWTSIFKGPLLIQQLKTGKQLTAAEQQTINDITTTWRQRLTDLSWFMKCLNEPLARIANKEDHCSGHFWEARFNSQALLTEASLLSCMAYVDLNPIRAKMANTPETSDYTSIKERITPAFDLQKAIKEQTDQGFLHRFNQVLKPLVPFEGNEKNQQQFGILFDKTAYLDLVDSTGRVIRQDKRGAIPEHLPPIIERLGIKENEWLEQATSFEKLYHKKTKHQNTFNSA